MGSHEFSRPSTAHSLTARSHLRCLLWKLSERESWGARGSAPESGGDQPACAHADPAPEKTWADTQGPRGRACPVHCAPPALTLPQGKLLVRRLPLRLALWEQLLHGLGALTEILRTRNGQDAPQTSEPGSPAAEGGAGGSSGSALGCVFPGASLVLAICVPSPGKGSAVTWVLSPPARGEGPAGTVEE